MEITVLKFPLQMKIQTQKNKEEGEFVLAPGSSQSQIFTEYLAWRPKLGPQ